MDYQVFSLIGLIFDAIGVIILFYWQPPMQLKDFPADVYIAFDFTPEQKRNVESQKKKAKCGLRFLLAGFLVQALATALSYWG